MLRLDRGCISITSVHVECVVTKESVCTGTADCTRYSMSQPDTENAKDSLRGRYCSISDATKLINQPFDGDKRKLK